MFMPQAQPHTRNAPGTTRRARLDKENAGALPSKTPSRAPLGKAGPSGRALGARTVDRNVQVQQPSEDIAPKRLFQDEGKKEKKVPLRLKTPGPSHMKTPGPRHMRTPAPLIYHDEPPVPLPSAQRTRRRSRASLQTPPHEDADISLDSILEAEVEQIEIVAEDDFELEYAAPTAVDRPYVPEWSDSVPNVVETMVTLAQIRPMSLRTPPSPPSPPRDLMDVEPFSSTITLVPDHCLNHPLLQKKKMTNEAKETARVPAQRAGATTTTSRSVIGASRTTATRPATATGAVRPTTSSAARARPPSATDALKRPTSTTATRAPITARAPVRPSTNSAPARVPLAAPRAASATTVRSGPSPASTAATSNTRPVRPATAAAVRTATRTSGPAGTTTRSATSTPTSRFTRLPPRIIKAVRAPVRPVSPGPALPAVGNDMLDLDLGVLDEKAERVEEVEDDGKMDDDQVEKVTDKFENAPKIDDGPKNEKEPDVDASLDVPKPESDASASALALAPVKSPLILSPATLHPLSLTPTLMSPLMSPRLTSSPLRDDVFDFAALTAALPSLASSTPEEHIEMSPLAQPVDLVPTPPGGQPDRLVITFANRRLGRISERTEVDSSFDDSFHTSFDASFDGPGADDNS
ncbi:uncharacterized protein CcaverHIS019_0301690 [Cutaneotrichosporon cavernicola]|uniref:Uncharacterized protein n=1 Tax=Cutaneotrichosporon cavernicola TaxID=279322 RepID=A0AA48I2N6_9TREE|nr:uncharacterized protein CcaverHIS019_0301690 [Cutaneotrichosporon cavernicola]BEI90099.1 hypothetical protein CcaverHIS019_0301690 [Cutaneotrichosporon cavernicola]BEI97877.1 hypothetical protein CcaverHIS631_0301760 [Cutaneotrichosporon cavernicola]BEJ05655.1 hypothetical protein CcaverHIS641_0301770 [Cutaneotrichosporon cavernicola]